VLICLLSLEPPKNQPPRCVLIHFFVPELPRIQPPSVLLFIPFTRNTKKSASKCVHIHFFAPEQSRIQPPRVFLFISLYQNHQEYSLQMCSYSFLCTTTIKNTASTCVLIHFFAPEPSRIQPPRVFLFISLYQNHQEYSLQMCSYSFLCTRTIKNTASTCVLIHFFAPEPSRIQPPRVFLFISLFSIYAGAPEPPPLPRDRKRFTALPLLKFNSGLGVVVFFKISPFNS
jgi:hypothetical protein